MGSPMRQPVDESGPNASSDVSSDASSGSAYTRDEVLRAQTITATSAARMITPGIQMRLWLGCMAFSLRARADGGARPSHHSENGHGAIPCRVFVGGEAEFQTGRSGMLGRGYRPEY